MQALARRGSKHAEVNVDNLVLFAKQHGKADRVGSRGWMH